MRFNVPVVVGQCPFLVFQLNRIDRDAIYISGSGTTDLLFQFQILLTDTKIGIDYADVFALRLSLCNPDDVRQDLSSMFIKRASMNPTIPANLTLPPIYSRLTVISPTSITGGGQNITLAGGTTHPKEVYSKYGFMNTTYSVGDIIDIRYSLYAPPFS